VVCVSDEVLVRIKRYIETHQGVSTIEVLGQVGAAPMKYRDIVETLLAGDEVKGDQDHDLDGQKIIFDYSPVLSSWASADFTKPNGVYGSKSGLIASSGWVTSVRSRLLLMPIVTHRRSATHGGNGDTTVTTPTGKPSRWLKLDFRLDGRAFHVLRGRHEACPVAAGDSNSSNDDDTRRVEITIDDQPASEWLE